MVLCIPGQAAEAEAVLGVGSVVVNFFAEWAEPCAHLNTVFAELAKEYTALAFVQVRHSAPLPGSTFPLTMAHPHTARCGWIP